MVKGTNIAESYSVRSFNNRKPVVFLSHKSEDKDFVEAIGNYFLNAGIDIYLDKNDYKLQSAVQKEDSKKITECIHAGIAKSDYILCFVSRNTVESWWVPYEIGYGKKAGIEIASLVRKDIEDIPDYLKIEKVIENISGINNFITDIIKKHQRPLMESYGREFASKDHIKRASVSHPLAKYLKL